MGVQMESDAGKEICKDMDVNNDGKITFKEFAKYVKKVLLS